MKRSVLVVALVVGGVTVPAAVAQAHPATGGDRPDGTPGVQRMHEHMREGSPGMLRMHELMNEGVPGQN
ncbi:hypothetical protein SAMN05661080_04670 [Modestobacter sp. DSM 44400]|uniref:hypothetical protein n=1 Tax=Modestobacter sp. DSM 44400 TaxID=1550230 RepID=UPI0008953A57|nr:hypothetical protein [Modestobacter sp. DSM 44400]SDY80720.1 hypothetical protein SAMN05661080_04670 [Modestobacter sp. DSM 44400]